MMLVHLALDTGLVALASAGSLWLRSHKTLEPDWTWVEVTIGVGTCLLVAEAHGRLAGGDWRDQQCRVIRTLALAGAPIIVGELAEWRERQAHLTALQQEHAIRREDLLQ